MSDSAWEAYSSDGDVGLVQYMKDSGTDSYQKGDFVQVYLDRLRRLAQTTDVSDILLLEVALRLGSVDSLGNPRAQGDYTQRVDERVLYRRPEEVSDGQLTKMLQHISLELQSQKIAPGTPIGAISATSISEPIYQAQMRTFHYAGVLTKEVDPFDVLNKQVSNTVDHANSELIVALTADIRHDRASVLSLAHRLERAQLKDYAKFTKYDPIFHEALVNDKVAEIDRKISAFLGGGSALVDGKMTLDVYTVPYFAKENGIKSEKIKENTPLELVRFYNRPLYDQIMKERDSKMFVRDSTTYTPEYQKLLDEKKEVQDMYLQAVLEAGRGSSFLVYLIDTEDDGKTVNLAKDWTQILDLKKLKKIVRSQLKASDGRFRQVSAFPGLFANAKVIETEVSVNGVVRPGVILNFPFLSSRLDMSLQSVFPDLEFCMGCHNPLTIAKLVNKKSRADKKVFEDAEWDSATPIDSYTMEIVQQSLREAGIVSNPDHTESDTTGLIEVDMTGSDFFEFEIAELYQERRCPKCGGGWFNVAVQPMKFDYENTESNEKFVVPFSNLTKTSVGSDSIAPNAGDMPETAYADFVRYPGFSQQGQHHDYPLQTMHSGQLPCDPIPNEWFLKILVDNPNDGRNDSFRGHLLTAQLSDFADFNRCNSNNLREIELVLGIEAARFTLAHGLAGEQDSAMNYKHYMLLADTMTNGVTIKTASAGSSSVRGVASEKGNRSTVNQIPSDTPDEVIIEALAAQGIPATNNQGEFVRESAVLKLELATAENFGSVLAQAYERQNQVVLKRAVQGLIDDLVAPNSAQIVGVPVRSGTQGGVQKGKYGTPNLESIIELVDEYLVTKDIKALNKLEVLMKGRVPTQIILMLKGEHGAVMRAMDRTSLETNGNYWWPREDQDGIGDLDQLIFDLKRRQKIGLPTVSLDEKINAHQSLLVEDEFADLMNRYIVLTNSLEIIRRIYRLDQ